MEPTDSSFFDLGDNTALVCVDHQQYQKMVVPQLIDMTYKVHLGLFEEDVLLKLKTYSYNVVVIYENFKGSTPQNNPILRVNDSGELEVPYIGLVPAAGRSCKELAYAVKAALEREYYYHATVIIAVDHVSDKSRGKIYVYGSVKGQGPQEIPADESYTVSKAIIRAGGFGDFANK